MDKMRFETPNLSSQFLFFRFYTTLDFLNIFFRQQILWNNIAFSEHFPDAFIVLDMLRGYRRLSM